VVTSQTGQIIVKVNLSVLCHKMSEHWESLYIKRGKVSVRDVHTSVMVGVASSEVNDVTTINRKHR